MDIAKQLQYIKKANNLTQQKMAELTGITQSTMSDWLNGKASPTITNLINLANNLNITLDYLVGRENEDGTIYIMGNQLSQSENELIDKLRQLDDTRKEIAYRYVDFLLNEQQKNNNL